VLVLELSNPPANTYSYEMMRQLDAHVLDGRMGESVHVIVSTGAGQKFFCAGADITMLETASPYFKYTGCCDEPSVRALLAVPPSLRCSGSNRGRAGGVQSGGRFIFLRKAVKRGSMCRLRKNGSTFTRRSPRSCRA
jgi:hypothetical protein